MGPPPSAILFHCAVIEARSLSSGAERASQEVCFGQDVADQLGPQVLNPSAELDAQCAGAPYACEVDGSRWDEDACVPWEPVDPDDDGGDGDGDGGDDAGDGDGGDDGAADGDDGGGDGGDYDGIAGRGCSCSSEPALPAAWWWLAVLGLPLFRRRR